MATAIFNSNEGSGTTGEMKVRKMEKRNTSQMLPSTKVDRTPSRFMAVVERDSSDESSRKAVWPYAIARVVARISCFFIGHRITVHRCCSRCSAKFGVPRMSNPPSPS